MDKNKIIILTLIVIIVALLVGIFATMPNFSKEDTKLRIATNSTITEGDYIKVKLTDLNKTPIANQTVNITIIDKDNSSSYYSAVTNDKGVAKLKSDKDAGEYGVKATYGGNNIYTESNATKNITIKEEVVEAQLSSTDSSSSNYDSGAFYSPQAGRVIYTGEVLDGPAGLHRHLGNNKWEPV